MKIIRLEVVIALSLFYAVLGGVVVADARAQSYAIFDLGTLGGNSSTAYGINNQCQIVGEAASVTVHDNAFLWEKGAMSYVPSLDNSCAGEAYAINDAKQIVGEHGVRVTYCSYDAFLWDSGVVIDLGSLGGGSLRSYANDLNCYGEVIGRSNTGGPAGPNAFLWLPGPAYGLPSGISDLSVLSGDDTSEAWGINSLGEVVGVSMPFGAGNPHHAFVWLPVAAYGLPAGMSDLGTLGGMYTHALDINDSGWIVGDSVNANGFTVAMLWKNGTMTDLQTVGGAFSSANAVNSSGDIVGMSSTNSPPPNDEHACMWLNGQPGPVDLNDSGYLPAGSPWVLRMANDINDRGQIVGWGIVNSGSAHAFLLTPVVSSDFDADGDVDLQDYAHYYNCETGPGSGPPASGCDDADQDGDGDVDLADYGLIQRCFSGPGVPALPGC